MFARPSPAFPLQMEMVVKVKSAGEGLAGQASLVSQSLPGNVAACFVAIAMKTSLLCSFLPC